jgi:hypothetical protein
MQESSEEAYLREMAKKCRLLADKLLSESAAASLRKLAQDYEEAAETAHQQSLFGGIPSRPNLGA